MTVRLLPGQPYPLGATADGKGVNFALAATNAEEVQLCLFDDSGQRETERVILKEYTNEVWHGWIADLRPGQLYGYRVKGPYDPVRGHRFNHNKLLIDPYAKAIRGEIRWTDAHYGYTIGHEAGDLSFDTRDSASVMPKCQIVSLKADSLRPHPPRVPWSETILYELHVKGYTILHPEVDAAARGRFAGLAAPAVIRHLKELGITAIELLPIHAFVDEPFLLQRNLRNYWGYNSVGFLAPDARYGALDDLKSMIDALHSEGIEVVLDVVYNHTAEGNHLGPTLSWRGIDNAAYYRLDADEPRYYQDFTGCGNAFNLGNPRTLQLVMDSLRYWVSEAGVDGFRFDLASTLARNDTGAFDAHSDFLDAVRQDPILSSVKLIAEPWDVGLDGYRLGGFPPGWAEWNDRYRNAVRRFWKGDDWMIGELATRVAGSADLFGRAGRRPWSSVNFVTAHDGFTLNDLVSYERKHNAANQENNRDGSDHNYSWNCGTEGPTSDPEIQALRFRQMRNLLSTLLMSQGVPMLCAGDEMARTQRGNNNAYCHDTELSWMHWQGVSPDAQALLAFTRSVIALRKGHPALRRERFFSGVKRTGGAEKDVVWLRPDAIEMKGGDWHKPEVRALCLVVNGTAVESPTEPLGATETDDSFLIAFNAGGQPFTQRLPRFGRRRVSWSRILDTATADGVVEGEALAGGAVVTVPPQSVSVFKRRRASAHR